MIVVFNDIILNGNECKKIKAYGNEHDNFYFKRLNRSIIGNLRGGRKNNIIGKQRRTDQKLYTKAPSITILVECWVDWKNSKGLPWLL